MSSFFPSPQKLFSMVLLISLSSVAHAGSITGGEIIDALNSQSEVGDCHIKTTEIDEFVYDLVKIQITKPGAEEIEFYVKPQSEYEMKWKKVELNRSMSRGGCESIFCGGPPIIHRLSIKLDRKNKIKNLIFEELQKVFIFENNISKFSCK